MFDTVRVPSAAELRRQGALVAAGARTAPPGAGDRTCATPDDSVPDAERVERIRALEELKSACAAAQAVESAALAASVRTGRAARGVPASERGRGVGAQVALARRESPYWGGRHLGLATALTTEMPSTLRMLADGMLSEWRATIIVRETACLSREDRVAVDDEVAAARDEVAAMGDGALAAWVRSHAYRLDPHAALARVRRAEKDRTVTLRPAPDGMARLSSLMPMAQGVAAWAALRREADSARAAGDDRSRGQLMADTAARRLIGAGHVPFVRPAAADDTGSCVADAATGTETNATTATTAPTCVPEGGADVVVAHVQLVMTDRSLLAGDDEPAWVPGVGPVPAGWARDLLRPLATASTAGVPGGTTLRAAEVWLRQLYADPETGELVAMRSRERRFPDGLRGFLVSRDRICRTPWCDAPIRHADHVVRASDGGDTSADNGDGLCEACNYARESGGWSARPSTDSRPGHHAVTITTPTGHTYVSRPPPLPGARSPAAPAGRSAPPERQVPADRIVTSFADLLHGAA